MENVTAATAEVAATAAADSGRHGPAFLVALLFMITAATVANLIAGSRVKKAKLDNLRFVTFPVSTEFVGMGEALRFPLTGSCVLFGLYMAYRYLPKEIINAILSAYLCLIGSGAVTIAVKPVLGANVIIGSIAIAVGAGYYWSKHWILNNILAFSLCVAGTESIPIKSFQASAALLIALFFYDIFWVFGTDVMVTVAKNVDGPIKLLFPQDILGDHTKKSLLGLGDIVVPGFFLMQMVRFSLIQSKGKSMKYFNVCMVAYVAALINAMFIMVYFDAAQPVLLYIVPWLLLTALGTAAATGQFKQLWEFDDEAHEKALLEEARAKFPERVAEAEKEAADRNNMSVVASIVDALLSVFGLDADSKKEAAAKKNKAAAKKKSA